MSLFWKIGTIPVKYLVTEYSCSALNSEELNVAMGQVEESLGIRMGENKLHQLPRGLYVHIYNQQETLKCSSFKLEEACAFFQFSMEPRQHDWPVSTKVDVQPFLYSNKDLLKLDGGNSELNYDP